MHINLVFECWLGHNAYDTRDVLFCNFSYVVCSEVAWLGIKCQIMYTGNELNLITIQARSRTNPQKCSSIQYLFTTF